MTTDQPVANRITINSAEQDDQIDSVAVFQANRAEVKRRVKLELKQGQNHVDIERLPTCINEDSIRVDGTGTAVIFDVVYHSPYSQSRVPKSDDHHQQAFAEASRALESLQKEREVTKEQSKFLDSYGKTLDSKSISIEDVERFLDMFGPRQGPPGRVGGVYQQFQQLQQFPHGGMPLAEEDEDLSGEGMVYYASAAPVQHSMTARSAKVVDAGVLSATFGIPGRSDIPSDESSHKVVISVFNLDAELEWVCVPREKESVFLRCKVLNASEFTLLPGEASVFMDDNFVSKSRIEHVAPNDTFKTSLGTDSALRVTYPPVRTHNRTLNRSSFFAGRDSRQSVAMNSQRITVRNSRQSTVSSLRVFDHVPVSTDAKIKVDVLSPNGIGPVMAESETPEGSRNKDRPWTNAQKGVKARWANLDVGGEGTVEWECEIEQNEELELELLWEVSAPTGQKWQTV
ncbi:hypothetical protein FRC12_006912 [Ceratobasidium sp. 428]|nr:hypothetical protein FRC12_006912 [Ceratobasidium sp. 428]